MSKLLSLTLCFILVACNLPGQQATTSTPQAWFDMPLPDTVFYPPNPCQVIAHGASPEGITNFELHLNGVLASAIPASDSKETLATLNADCPPLAPGKNILEVRAQDGAGVWSEFTQTIVFLAESDTPAEPSPLRPTLTPASTFTAIPSLTATRIPTLTPTETATLAPVSGVTVERLSANLVYLGRASCGPVEVTIVARAVAPSGIKVVVLFYRFQTANASTEFQSVGMKPIGGDLYEVTLNLNSLLGGAVPFDAATLQYQIVIQQSNGDTSLRTPVLSDIAVQACGGATTSCSAYTTESACVEHGCNWVSIPGTVPTYECRSP